MSFQHKCISSTSLLNQTAAETKNETRKEKEDRPKEKDDKGYEKKGRRCRSIPVEEQVVKGIHLYLLTCYVQR